MEFVQNFGFSHLLLYAKKESRLLGNSLKASLIRPLRPRRIRHRPRLHPHRRLRSASSYRSVSYTHLVTPNAIFRMSIIEQKANSAQKTWTHTARLIA